MSVIHTPRKPVLDLRMLLFPSAIFSLLLVLFLRLWFFQVVKAEELTEKAQMYNQTDVVKLAPRGMIYDRKGRVIAGIRPQLVITGVPRKVNQNKWVLDKLAAMLPDTSAKKLSEKLAAGNWRPWLPTTIYIGAPIEVAARIAEGGEEDLPGISVDSLPMRYYPDSQAFAHLLGYVWVPSPDDVKRLGKMGRKPADYVGKGGVEYAYEANLMGVPGADRMEVDAKRRPIRVVGRDAPTPGDQLVLSIDKDLQEIAIEELKGSRGSVVAIDPNNGEVLCLASSPGFDTKLFDKGISKTDWDALMNNPEKPFLNRPLQSAFAPGSTFKLVTTMAAMQAGTFDPHRTVYCNGGYRLGNKFFKCLGRHGSVSFNEAMTKSCNTYFMTIGAGLGGPRISKTAMEVGLGSKVGIELGGDSKGVVLNDKMIARYRKPARWMPYEPLLMSIGQGELSCTAIQMAQVMALVANNGTSFKPHLVRAIRKPGSDQDVSRVEPVVSHHVDASDQFWTTLKEALVAVVDHGTAASGKIPGLVWGGKTGSAEEKKGQLTHSWFIGFAPYDHPKIAICVFRENSGHGSKSVPIAARIVQRYLFGPPKAPATSSKVEPEVSATRTLSSAPIDR